MNYFTITTKKETALKIEKFFQSRVLSEGRSLKLGQIRHEDGLVSGYSVVQIISTQDNGMITTEDIFWLGYFSALL